jgi:hypothetical protein
MAKSTNTTAFYVLAWVSFIVSSVGTLLGLLYLMPANADWSVRGFFIMSYLFMISSCFTLAKVIRDRAEEEA